MSKINGLLNFIRVVFADDSRLVTKHLDVPRQIIMPGASSSSHYYNMETNYGAGTSWLKEYLTVESDLLSRYIDYEDMDDYPEIAASLDLFSDDATQPDGLTGKIVKVECKDQSINDILDDMFHKNIRIDEEIWEMARCLCKYGNNFEELIIKDGEGVVDINFMPPPTVRRVEDVEGILLGFVQDYSANFRISTEEFVERINDRSSESTFLTNAINRGSMPVRTYENWEVVHFRLRSKYRRAMYGFSVIDSVRWLMKRLLLLEDSMLIYRMTRAPERFAFYVDVGDIPPNEAVAYVKKIKNEYKKKKWIDESCLTADTLISCVNGKDISIKELADSGEEFWVWSYDTQLGKVVSAKSEGAWISGEKVPVYRVVLDNGTSVRCTADHPFLMRDGTYKHAIDLVNLDSLMPFNLHRGRGDGYLAIYDQVSRKTELAHKIAARCYFGDSNLVGNSVHHIDRNKWNNGIDNLELLTPSDHMCRHPENADNGRDAFVCRVKNDTDFSNVVYSRLEDWRSRTEGWKTAGVVKIKAKKEERRRVDSVSLDLMIDIVLKYVCKDLAVTQVDLVSRLNSDKEFMELYCSLAQVKVSVFVKHHFQHLIRKCGFDTFHHLKDRAMEIVKKANPTFKEEISNNHKVISVEFCGYEDVYDLSVPLYHNFALSVGAFVHNTGKLDMSQNILCLSLSTRIPVLDGSTKTLSELIQDHKDGVNNYVYSIDRDTKRIVPGEVEWAGVTRLNAELVKVTIDNCREEIVTPDHKFMLRTGEYKEAKDLVSGDSLMPLNRGINKTGYEYVVHPDGSTSWDCLETTHRMVARSLLEEIEGMEVHHKGNRRNNMPNELEVLTQSEHASRHASEKSERIKIWNKTEAHSQQVSMNNVKYLKSDNIIRYNASEQHKIDNEIRSKAMSKAFAERYDEICAAMRIKFPSEMEAFLVESVRNNPSITTDDLCEMVMMDDEVFEVFKAHNTREIKNVHRHMLLAGLRQFGYESFKEFKKKTLYNHKVVSVEYLPYREDTGCITVKKWHNFGLESGVFVKNSADEDFFIPTRGDKKTTSIESIGGFSYTGIDDINYFQNKMFAGLKIPKDYLNYSDGGTTKSSLSQEDMRFARSVLRIQSVLRSGMEKMGRVHLAALGIQPDAVDWKVQMNPPSSIFELAMMEVRNAQLDLAERYKAFASQYWIMTNILHMTDEEINTINGQRKAQYLDKSNYPDFEARDYPRGFFDGNKEAEKILADNMDKVFTQSPALKHRFDELKGMMHDMKCHLHKK